MSPGGEAAGRGAWEAPAPREAAPEHEPGSEGPGSRPRSGSRGPAAHGGAADGQGSRLRGGPAPTLLATDARPTGPRAAPLPRAWRPGLGRGREAGARATPGQAPAAGEPSSELLCDCGAGHLTRGLQGEPPETTATSPTRPGRGRVPWAGASPCGGAAACSPGPGPCQAPTAEAGPVRVCGARAAFVREPPCHTRQEHLFLSFRTGEEKAANCVSDSD